MKRTRSEDSPQLAPWPQPRRRALAPRAPYKQESAPQPAWTKLEPKLEPHCSQVGESLDGIIDSALAAFHTAASATHAPPSKQPRRAPQSSLLRPQPKEINLGFIDSANCLLSNTECLTPLLTTSGNAFEDLPPSSSGALSQQTSAQSQRSSLHSSPQGSYRESFERVGAEIDEILSPMTQCSSGRRAPPPHAQAGLQDITALLAIPATSVHQPGAGRKETSSSSVQAKGKAMQEILKAIAAPSPPASTGSRRSASSAPTQCHVCGKTYTESSNLSKHIRTVHLKLRPFQCHLCPSSFAEKNKLGKHIQSVHEHARPYKCELCSATFSQASDRKRHRLVLHEGRRPFTCVYCEKAFGRRSSLTQHCSRVHKDGKPPGAVPRMPV